MSTTTNKPDPWRDQVMRLSSLAYFPQFPEGAKELKETLKRRAKDLAHATRVIDHITETFDTCPSPAVIAQLCRDVSSDEPIQLPIGCERCFGADFVQTEIRGYSCTMRCNCPRGRRLAELDAQRRKAEPEKRQGNLERADFRKLAGGDR